MALHDVPHIQNGKINVPIEADRPGVGDNLATFDVVDYQVEMPEHLGRRAGLEKTTARQPPLEVVVEPEGKKKK